MSEGLNNANQIKTTNAQEAKTMTNPLNFDIFALTTHYGKSVQEVIDSKKPVGFVMDETGQVFEVRNTKNGTFIAKADKVLGANKIEEGFIRNPELGLIPFELMLQVVSFFKDVCDEFNDDESMLQIYFDKSKGEYFLTCPKQTTTKTHITFVHDPALQNNENMIYVMDIHSHNSMSAFFSGTDDASEQETRLYGVVGRLDNLDKGGIPEYKFRISVEGKFVPMNIFDFFQKPKVRKEIAGASFEKDATEADLFFPKVDYPAEWLEIIREGKVNRAAFSGKGNPRSNGKFGITDMTPASTHWSKNNPATWGNNPPYANAKTGGYAGRPDRKQLPTPKHAFGNGNFTGVGGKQLGINFEDDPFVVTPQDIVGDSFRSTRPTDEIVSEFGTPMDILEEVLIQRDTLIDYLSNIEGPEQVEVIAPLLEMIESPDLREVLEYVVNQGLLDDLDGSDPVVAQVIYAATADSSELDGDEKIDAIIQSLGALTHFELKRVLTELVESGYDHEFKEVLKNTGNL